MPLTPSYHMYPCGDYAVTIELGDKIDVTIHQQVMTLFVFLKSLHIKGVKDIIPAYHSVTVIYDIVALSENLKKATVYELVCAQLEEAVTSLKPSALQTNKLVRIPVCYDSQFAPDLESLATLHSINIEEVIRLHTSKKYRVYMLGFLPGFTYMGIVDPKIWTPRKEQPRTHVPAGSVGIAGEQTGIYPFDSPGGWQIIGRTPIAMFSSENENPCYVAPGDEVEFYPISVSAFNKLKKA